MFKRIYIVWDASCISFLFSTQKQFSKKIKISILSWMILKLIQ